MGPCLNPNCKSHGKPHPNCRCYGMASGGEVGHFCDGPKAHHSDCEYYMAEGGEIDPSQVVVDEPIEPSKVKLDEEINPKEVKLDSEKYETTGQKFKAAAEGALQGFAGPLAPLIETKVFGTDPEDIKGRQRAHPIIHGVAEAATIAGGLLTGIGEAGLIAKGAGAISEVANLGKVGSAALKGMIEGASFVSSDEITKAMLRRPGSDPEEPVSAALLHVGAGGLMGGLGGSVFSLGEGMIGKASDKMAKAAEDYLYKIAEEGTPFKMAPEKIADFAALSISKGNYGTYKIAKMLLRKPIEKIVGRAIAPANEYVTDAAISALLTNEAAGVSHVVHYANQITKGVRAANEGIDALFTGGASKVAPEISDNVIDELKEFIEAGQIQKQIENTKQEQPSAFARGGMVPEPNNQFEKVLPEQNMLLNVAKGRISNYLNSQRPLANTPKLPFDKRNKDAARERGYSKALGLAASPLKVLDSVNKGSLTPEDMKHFVALYPDVHKYLSKQMTKRIVQAQLSGETPPYKKRQSMSLFLGAPLDSTFTPSAMMAIQNTFIAKQVAQQQQAPQQNKKGTSSLSKSSNQYQTDEQSREKRMQNQKT